MIDKDILLKSLMSPLKPILTIILAISSVAIISYLCVEVSGWFFLLIIPYIYIIFVIMEYREKSASKKGEKKYA